MNFCIASTWTTARAVHGRGDLRVEELGGPAAQGQTGVDSGPADRGRRGPAGGHGAPSLPDADGLPGRTGPPGRPPRRARHGDFSPPERRALRHGRRPQQPAGHPAVRHRRHFGGDRHPRRRHQSGQRPRLGRQRDLGPSGRHQPNTQPPRHGPLEHCPRQRRLDPELRLRCVHHAADRRRHQHRAPRLLHPNRGNCYRGGGHRRVQGLHRHPAGRLQHDDSDDPGHHRCAGALRNGGPAGRRNCGGAGVLQHHGPNEPGHHRCAGALRNGGPAGRRHRSGARGLQHHGPDEPGHCRRVGALRDCGRAGLRNHGGAGALQHHGPNEPGHRGGGGAEQRPVLDRRADLQPAAGQQRAPEPVRGRRIDRQLPEPGRHDPHRIGQLRPQRDLHASGNGRSDHRRHRRPGPVPIPKRGGGAGPHRHGPGALLGPNGGLDLRGRRAGQLRHEQLGDLGHLLGPVQLRQQLPGRFQDRHGPAGFLHQHRSRSADCQCAGERGSEQLLHASRDAELRGQRAARVLPPHRAGFAADSHPHPVLDVGANPNGDRRRHRRRGLPHPSAGGRPVLRGQRQRELRVPGAHQRHASPNQGPPAPGAPGGQHHPHGNHARAHLRRLFEGGGGRAVPEQQQLRAARRQVLRSESVGGRGQRPLPPRPGPVHAPDHPQPALPVAPHRGRHSGQRQRHRDRGGLLEQGPERQPLPPGGHLQLPRKHGHRPSTAG